MIWVPRKDHNARHPLQHDGNDIQRRAVLVPDAEPCLSRCELRQRNSQVLLELVFDFETVDIRRSGAAPDSFSVPPGDLRPALEVFLGNRRDTGVGMRIRLIGLKQEIGRLPISVLLAPDNSRRHSFRQDFLPDDTRHTNSGDFQRFPAVEPHAQLNIAVGCLRIHEPEILIHEFFVLIEDVLIAARDCEVKRFVYASSSSVYGDEARLPKVEEQVGCPLSPYAATKVANELLVFPRNNSRIYYRDGNTRFLLPAAFH